MIKFKRNNIGDRVMWEFGDGEGGSGVVIEREPYRYWAKCDETGEVVEVNLRRHLYDNTITLEKPTPN